MKSEKCGDEMNKSYPKLFSSLWEIAVNDDYDTLYINLNILESTNIIANSFYIISIGMLESCFQL